MRIAGSQAFEAMRAVVKHQKSKNDQTAETLQRHNIVDGDNGVVTPEDLEKTTLFGAMTLERTPEQKKADASKAQPGLATADPTLALGKHINLYV